MGITMDLTPVVDLMPDKTTNVDWNTRIATRSISRDPAVVATIAGAFARGLLDAGITPTAKRVAVDTHLFGASLEAAESELQMLERSARRLGGLAAAKPGRGRYEPRRS